MRQLGLNEPGEELDPSVNPSLERRWAHQAFRNGEHGGKSVLDLKEKLRQGIMDIPSLVAVRHRGSLWLVFGNRRLKMLKELELEEPDLNAWYKHGNTKPMVAPTATGDSQKRSQKRDPETKSGKQVPRSKSQSGSGSPREYTQKAAFTLGVLERRSTCANQRRRWLTGGIGYWSKQRRASISHRSM